METQAQTQAETRERGLLERRSVRQAGSREPEGASEQAEGREPGGASEQAGNQEPGGESDRQGFDNGQAGRRQAGSQASRCSATGEY